ncbi:RepB family plasmid replication initiator protein, partial [bacterium]
MEKDSLIQVRQHNVITNARHELSAVQLDIYFMLLSRLRPGDNMKYEIGVKEIEDLTGRQWNYQQLKDATLGMIGKVF